MKSVHCWMALLISGVMYLQLVLAGLSLRGGVQKVDCENLETNHQHSIHLYCLADAFAVRFGGFEGIFMHAVQSCASRPGLIATAHLGGVCVPCWRCFDANR